MKSPLSYLALAVACCWAAASAARAAGEERQRLAAEIVIMTGDVRRLIHESPPPLERLGLERRVTGALASLPLSLRRAGDDPADVTRAAAHLRTAIEKRNWRALVMRLDTLRKRHPFDPQGLIGAAPDPQTLATGADIHREVCAACHDAPSHADTLLPAKNLVAQRRSMPREEFAARLWLGVRGTRDTHYANPFSNAELAALFAWYGTQ